MIGLYNRQFRKGMERSILSLLGDSPQASLLDLGCGDGSFTGRMGKRMGTNNLSGIDIIERSCLGVVTTIRDLEEPFPFPDTFFDIVVASQIIEHIHDTDGFVKEIYRVLKPTGNAIISTPNLSSLHIVLLLLLGRQPITCSISDEIGEEWMEKGPRHRRLFTMVGLVKLLEFHGFAIEKEICSGYFPLPRIPARVACTLDRWHSNCITVRVRKLYGKD